MFISLAKSSSHIYRPMNNVLHKVCQNSLRYSDIKTIFNASLDISTHATKTNSQIEAVRVKMHYSIDKVQFSVAKKEDLVLLRNWLAKPYIQEYWKDGGIIIPDFEKFTNDQPSIFKHFFGYYESLPFAFFCTSEIKEGDDFVKWREKNGVTLSFDFMIGEEAFIGKGFAHLIIEKFIKDQCSDAAAIIGDPEEKHIKSIRVLEKAGFEKVGIFYPEEGQWAHMQHSILKKIITNRKTSE